MAKPTILDKGTLSFTIESRVLRELGERLVKQPEVALLELIKNAYDADASNCTVAYAAKKSLSIRDDGLGMTKHRFETAWMRIGTSAKESASFTKRFNRLITGEKGIGRFAVRFLGRALHLESTADDPVRHVRTRLIADFDWPKFDRREDLGQVKVPYRLEVAPIGASTGTLLLIKNLRSQVADIDFQKVRTGSLGVLSPLRSLFPHHDEGAPSRKTDSKDDPGFQLIIQQDDGRGDDDVAAAVLHNFVLRAQLQLESEKVTLRIFKRGDQKAYIRITDTFPNDIGRLYCDIRFFPRRAGTFTRMPVNGQVAQRWVAENSGVAVFDRNFRVQPYGTSSDDWLQLQADAARNRREPRSQLAIKHFPMSAEVKASTSENWMLRLPESAQLVGLVQVSGRRIRTSSTAGERGLIASADREGFVENSAFRQMNDLVRGAVEAIAYADRRLQVTQEEEDREALIASLRRETRVAIQEIQSNANITAGDKARIINALAETQQIAERHQESTRSREQQLEVMSLLGVVAGFMSHEFGVALQELEETHKELLIIAKIHPKLSDTAEKFARHIKNLKEFVTYSSGYIQGAKSVPEKPYPAKPRLQQVKRIFGRYAEERGIGVEINAENDLMVPRVPAALYNGLALNLYTNALKAVTAKADKSEGKIAFRSWNDERWHYLEVSDTGIGIPSTLHERVFDPLFTTTDSNRDPLGSGMGLGLALVRRGAEAFGGRADVVDPPPGFSTCVRIRLPMNPKGAR